MAGLTTVGAGIELDALTGRAAQAARTVYLALLTAVPDASTTLASMSELSGSGYARQSVAWTAPSAGSTGNAAQVQWGPFGFDPAPVLAVALVSAGSGTSGDLLRWWLVSKDVGQGDYITAAAGALTIAVS